MDLTYRDIHRALIAAAGKRQGISYHEARDTVVALGYTNPLQVAKTISTLAAERAIRVYGSGFVLVHPELPR